MKLTPTLLFISLLLFSTIAIAQDQKKIDSLLNIYNNTTVDTLKIWTLSHLFSATEYNNPIQAKKYVDALLNLSKEINYKSGLNRAYWHLGAYYKNRRELDSAEYFLKKTLPFYKNNPTSRTIITHALAVLEYDRGNYKKALKIVDQNLEIHKPAQDSLGLSRSYDVKSAIYKNMGFYKLAYENTFIALKIYENLNNKGGQADLLNRLANLESDRNKAIAYNKKAIALYETLNDTYFLSQAINDIGVKYYYLGNYDEAQSYFEKSLSLSKETGAKNIEGTALYNLARVFSAKNKLKKAIDLLTESLNIHKGTNNKNKIAQTLTEIGRTHNLLEQPKQAIPHLTEAITIYKDIGAKDWLKEAHFERSNSYELLEDYKKTLFDYEEFNIISGDLYTETKSQQIEELKTIYETEKKEQQIELLEEKEKVSALQKSLLGGGLLLTLGIVGFGFYGFRQKIKRNKLEKEKLDNELVFKKKELTTHALHLAKKNETLESLKQKAVELKTSENGNNGYQQIIRTIDFDLKDDNNWENFSKYFQEVHTDFNSNVKKKFPEVTSNELRLMSLLKMNLSSKEIANILNISQEGIKKARYRLRKKLQITTEDSLQDLVLSL